MAFRFTYNLKTELYNLSKPEIILKLLKRSKEERPEGDFYTNTPFKLQCSFQQKRISSSEKLI